VYFDKYFDIDFYLIFSKKRLFYVKDIKEKFMFRFWFAFLNFKILLRILPSQVVAFLVSFVSFFGILFV